MKLGLPSETSQVEENKTKNRYQNIDACEYGGRHTFGELHRVGKRICVDVYRRDSCRLAARQAFTAPV